MWNCNIRVVIIPSILALAGLGLSIYFNLLPDFNLLPLGTWLAGDGAEYIESNSLSLFTLEDIYLYATVPFSMVVNALVTGLIVYRIFRVFREVEQGSTSIEKSLGVDGGRKYRSLIFVIIESGIALFAIQLVRVMLTIMLAIPIFSNPTPIGDALNFIIVTHQMFNVTITLVIINIYFADNVDLDRV